MEQEGEMSIKGDPRPKWQPRWREAPGLQPGERAGLLPRMMRANGLDPAALKRRHPDVTLSLWAGCTLCEAVERCARCLDDGTAGTECGGFCLNAPVLDAVARAVAAPRRRNH
jgi:hypothetical protein